MFDTYLNGFAYPLKSPLESAHGTRTLIEDRKFSTEKVSTLLPRIEAGVWGVLLWYHGSSSPSSSHHDVGLKRFPDHYTPVLQNIL